MTTLCSLRALLVLTCVVAAVMVWRPAAADNGARLMPMVQAGAGLGVVSLGPPYSPGPSSTIFVSLALTERIALGATASRSNVRMEDGGRAELTHFALEGEWRMDHGRVVPTVHAGVGGLAVGSVKGAPLQRVTHLAAGVDWWPHAPGRGISLGAEIRYLGTFSVDPTPLANILALRARFGW